MIIISGMWIIPVGLAIRNHWWRFPCVWLFFSAVTSIVTKKSLEKPIQVALEVMTFDCFQFVLCRAPHRDWCTNGSC